LPHRGNGVRTGRGNHNVHAEPHYLGSQGKQPFQLAIGEAILDDDILANAVPTLRRPFLEGFDAIMVLLTRRDREAAYPVDRRCRSLRARIAAALPTRHQQSW
jgi:hypothetical protein